MKVRTEELRGTEDDIILIITCDCGNERMEDVSSQHVMEKIYIYRYGAYPKSFLCAQPEKFLLKEIAAGRKQCFRRYIITLHNPIGESPFLEIEHLLSKMGTPKKVVEVQRVPFPPKVIKKQESMYPPSTYVANPYKKDMQ